MARKCGEAQIVPLNEQDLQLAEDLLKWSRNLDNEIISWEAWEKRESYKEG